jgi:glycosyltransferase involved in cell wall biosynthesis
MIASRVAVVVPALNEELRIREVVEGALQHAAHVILVDDGSTDATLARVADLPIRVIRHAVRRGKGEGLRDGFRAALELDVDGVLTMDGDGQHLASDIPRLLAAARAYPQHIVVGAACASGPSNRSTAASRTNSATGASPGPPASASPTPRAASAGIRARSASWPTSRARASCSRPTS